MEISVSCSPFIFLLCSTLLCLLDGLVICADHAGSPMQAPCIDNFLPWEVVPCRENDRSAIYEVDEDGEAYGNIYELRKVVDAELMKLEFI